MRRRVIYIRPSMLPKHVAQAAKGFDLATNQCLSTCSCMLLVPDVWFTHLLSRTTMLLLRAGKARGLTLLWVHSLAHQSMTCASMKGRNMLRSGGH